MRRARGRVFEAAPEGLLGIGTLLSWAGVSSGWHTRHRAPTVGPMGSWATLNVGGHDVFHWKSEVDPTFLFLFTRSDVSYIPLKDPHDDPYANPTLVLKSTVKVLTDRLDALGVSAGDLDGCLQYGIDQQIKLLEMMPPDAGGPEDDAAIQDLRNLTFEAWAKRVHGPHLRPMYRSAAPGAITATSACSLSSGRTSTRAGSSARSWRYATPTLRSSST
jgi:hypothetical protein